MHRSGTSLLTGILQENGLNLGDVKTKSAFNAKGNRELLTLSKFHESIFERRGGSWKRPPSAIVKLHADELTELNRILEPFRDSEFWGFKDPRTLWLVEPYLKLFPDARPIGVFRESNAVAQSLAARPGALKLTYEEGIALWRRSNCRLLDLWEQRPFPLLEFSGDVSRSAAFKLPLQRFLAANDIERMSMDFFDDDLVSQAAGTEIHDPESEDIFKRLRLAARESDH